MHLEIIYKDEYLVAINKPHGLLVHKSGYASNANEFAIQLLRDQIGRKVYPCHRIDRKTGGVLLFALNSETNCMMQTLFARNKIKKEYLAIVRGYSQKRDTINYPITNEKGKTQEAVTVYKTLKQSEVDIPSGKFETSRYSLVEVLPQTGRMHQIRKHFAHIMHPIIGDRPHGCNKQNKIFKEKFNMTTMMLHALELKFIHPKTNQEIIISASPQEEFKRTKKILNL